MKRFDLVKFIERQKAFSSQAFGPGERRAGVANHILEECEEVQSCPDDLSEWVDLMLLSLDASWRSGVEPEAMALRIAPGHDGGNTGDLIQSFSPETGPVEDEPTSDGDGPLSGTQKALFRIRTYANRMKDGTLTGESVTASLFCSACEGALDNGFTLKQIAEGLEAKLERNRKRTWPDWRTMSEDDAINHKK